MDTLNTRGKINIFSARRSPGALTVLAHGQSKVDAAPGANVSLVEGVVGQVGQANKRLVARDFRGQRGRTALGNK